MIRLEPGLSSLEQATLVPTLPLSPPQLNSQQRQDWATSALQALQQGLEQFQAGHYSEALSLIQQALQGYRHISSRSGECKALLALSALYYQLSDYLWALDYARQSLTLARKIKAQDLVRQALSYMGNSYRHLGDLEQAVIYMTRCLEAAQAARDITAEMHALNNLAMVHRLRQQHQSAVDLYRASLVLSQQLGQTAAQAQILRNLGNACYALGDYPATTTYYDQLLRLIEQSPQGRENRAVMLRILRNLTSVCTAQGNYQQAVQYLDRRWQIVRVQGDVRGEEQILEHMASSYEALDQVDKALDCHERRLKLLGQMSDRTAQRQAFNRFRCACLSHGRFERITPYLAQFEEPSA